VVKSSGAALDELEALYRESLPRFVRAAAAILADEGLGREAVQDAFAQAVRERGSFRRDVPLEAWVWRIVVNAALTIRRRPRPEQEWDAERHDIQASNGAPAADFAVRAWVAALPERQRLVVFLRYFAGLDYRGIAAALDIDVGTVSATLSAAHTSLRRSMQEEAHR
jgi:RNA polymerase sigma-70 factor (ECF subfamily)